MLGSYAQLLYLCYGGFNEFNDEHTLPLCYISSCLIQDHMH
jgi:hypothetical protein